MRIDMYKIWKRKLTINENLINLNSILFGMISSRDFLCNRSADFHE